MRLSLTAIAAFALASAADAGELSSYEPIGHSPDGSHYAFIETGVTDGAGAPYVNGYLIDTASDSWVAGTPIRLGGGEPGDLDRAQLRARLDGLRAEAKTLIDAAAAEAGVPTDWRRGDLLALSPVTDLERDGTRMTVNPLYIPQVVLGTITAELTEVPFPAGTNGCPDGMGDIVGFRLALEDGHSRVVLNEDTALPGSRGCPIGYRIGGIETFTGMDGERTTVVLVQMSTVGFEGPDGRWLAVTHRGP